MVPQTMSAVLRGHWGHPETRNNQGIRRIWGWVGALGSTSSRSLQNEESLGELQGLCMLVLEAPGSKNFLYIPE